MCLEDVLVVPVTEGVTFNMCSERVKLPLTVPHTSGWLVSYSDIEL